MGLLEKKVGLVTGSGMGSGRAIAMSFARECAKVVVADFNVEAGNESVELIKQAGGEACFAGGDVSKEDQVKATIHLQVV